MKCLYWMLFCIAAALPFSKTFAQLSLGLTAEAKVTAGIDPETRALIERMPKELKEQTLDLLQKALPLIDQSASKYLDRVNDIVNAQLVHAGCAVQGTLQGSLGVFKYALPFQGKPTPVSDIANELTRIKRSFSRYTLPSTYVASYGDFLANSAVTACQVEASSEALQTIQPYQADARSRWQAWRRAAGGCTSAETCVDFVMTEVTRFVSLADVRDVTTVRAEAAIARISKPKVDSGWFSSFDQSPFEDAMSALFRVEDSIVVARVQRDASASSKLDAVRAQYSKSAAKLSDASAKLRSFGSFALTLGAGNPPARDIAASVEQEVVVEQQDIAAALAISNAVSESAEALRQQVISLGKDAESLRIKATPRR